MAFSVWTVSIRQRQLFPLIPFRSDLFGNLNVRGLASK
jgi:hypothetical protein